MATTTEDTESTNSTGGSLGGKFKQRNMNRYKTELCRAFEEAGQCKYAEKCQVRCSASSLRGQIGPSSPCCGVLATPLLIPSLAGPASAGVDDLGTLSLSLLPCCSLGLVVRSV